MVPFIKATQDRVVLEIQRGCIRGCRFCQAGMLYRPTRERDLEMLKKAAYAMLKNTGYEEISLSSLSSSDYSHLKELVTFLIDEFGSKDINISLPSIFARVIGSLPALYGMIPLQLFAQISIFSRPGSKYHQFVASQS